MALKGLYCIATDVIQSEAHVLGWCGHDSIPWIVLVVLMLLGGRDAGTYRIQVTVGRCRGCHTQEQVPAFVHNC